MTSEQLAKLKPLWRSEVESATEKMIREACGICHGENYKRYVPLQELINYKIDATYRLSSRNCMDKNSYKFKKFVEAADNIVADVASKWPFIDIEGIDINWTSDQIVNQVISMYANVPALKFDGQVPAMRDNTEDLQKIDDIICKHLGLKQNARFNRSKELGNIIIKQFNIKNKDYWCNDEVDRVINEIKEEFEEIFVLPPYISPGQSIKGIKKSFSEKNKF